MKKVVARHFVIAQMAAHTQGREMRFILIRENEWTYSVTTFPSSIEERFIKIRELIGGDFERVNHKSGNKSRFMAYVDTKHAENLQSDRNLKLNILGWQLLFRLGFDTNSDDIPRIYKGNMLIGSSKRNALKDKEIEKIAKEIDAIIKKYNP